MFRSYLWGCFYLVHNRNPAGSLRLLLQAVGAWSAAALVLLPLSALLLSRLPIGSAALGYWSSSLSFLAAWFAGRKAGNKRENGSLLFCLPVCFVLITLLLTIGFLAGGSLDPSGVLSVVSFTFAGVLLGGLMASGRKGRTSRASGKRKRFSTKRG